jgi:hypothetical protein
MHEQNRVRRFKVVEYISEVENPLPHTDRPPRKARVLQTKEMVAVAM